MKMSTSRNSRKRIANKNGFPYGKWPVAFSHHIPTHMKTTDRYEESTFFFFIRRKDRYVMDFFLLSSAFSVHQNFLKRTLKIDAVHHFEETGLKISWKEFETRRVIIET